MNAKQLTQIYAESYLLDAPIQVILPEGFPGVRELQIQNKKLQRMLEEKPPTAELGQSLKKHLTESRGFQPPQTSEPDAHHQGTEFFRPG